MLEHDVWSPGHLTVLTIRARRRRELAQRRHEVEVRRDGVRLAEGDEHGLLRATTGLVLAEAVLAGGPGVATSSPSDGAGVSAGPGASGAPAWGARPRPGGRNPGTRPAPLWAGDADAAPEEPPASPAGAVDVAARAPVLTVDVFGVRQGEVRVTAAGERLTARFLRADLLVGGTVAARLRTLGRQAEEAVVEAGGRELARLARFDHLRGVDRTVSSWDLAVAEIEDPRLRAVTVAAVLRLAALREAARDADPRPGWRGRRRAGTRVPRS